MTVDTKTVQGRRKLAFHSLDEVVADAETMVSSPTVRTLGNYPVTRLLPHLALTVDKSIDGIPIQSPLLVRFIGFFLKGRILKRGMTPGFTVSKEHDDAIFPTAASPEEAVDELRRAVNRLQTERMTARHPVFGKLTHDEWTQLHLRHAELHLSFVTPG